MGNSITHLGFHEISQRHLVEAFDIGGVVTCQQHSFDGNFFLCPRLVYSALYTLWQKHPENLKIVNLTGPFE